MERRIVSKYKLMSWLVAAGVGGIGLISLAMLVPNVSYSSALDCQDENSCTSALAETEAEVKVKTSIAVATSSKVAMEVVPTSTGATTIGSTDLSVSTNSIDGYALYMQSSDGLINTSTIHDGNVGIEKISIVNAPTTLASMASNSYGYYIGETVADSNTEFKVLPTTNAMVKQTASTTGGAADTSYGYGDSYKLSFGVKVGTELPAGTYSGSVTVSAVANPETVRSMAGLDYMQDMTADICTNTREGYTKQLIDTRDGKSYWVAKLKDGNCWMAQNLALDITEAGLSASDTDITEDWNQDSEYPPNNANRIILNGAQYNTGTISTEYWIFNKAVLATPTIAKRCSTGVQTNQTFGEMCGEVGFIDIDETWKSTWAAQEGSWTLSDGTVHTGLIAADKSSKTYDAHYLVGNYYQWNAAVAGTGETVMNTVDASAPGSICPKNWKMPTSPKNSMGDFAKLLDAYGLLINRQLGYFKKDEYSLSTPPFYFNAVGMVYRWSGTVDGPGNVVDVYSSTVNDKDINGNSEFGGNFFNYSLNANPNTAIFIRSEGFYYGVSVRCVAR